jgi:hypothetical protein
VRLQRIVYDTRCAGLSEKLPNVNGTAQNSHTMTNCNIQTEYVQ